MEAAMDGFLSPAALRLSRSLQSSNASLEELVSSSRPDVSLPNGVPGPSLLDPDSLPLQQEWSLLVRSTGPALRSVFFARPMDPYAAWALVALTRGARGTESQLQGRFLSNRLQFDVAERGPETAAPSVYTIKVAFDTATPGDYDQVLVADFGDGRRLGIPLQIKSGEEDPDKPKWRNESAKEEQDVGRSGSEFIIMNTSEDEDSHSQYCIDAPPFIERPAPPSKDWTSWERGLEAAGLCEAEAAGSDVRLGETWTRGNYVKVLGHLLGLEQAARAYCLLDNPAMSEIEVGKSFTLTGTTDESTTVRELRVAPPGELLGKITLDGCLSEDTASGRLLVTQCDTVDIELVSGPPSLRGLGKGERRVRWGCVLESGGKTRDVVLFRISPDLVAHHHISVGEEPLTLSARVTFCLAPLAFAEMRFALRSLPDLRLLFPESRAEEGPAALAEADVPGLNAKQRAVTAAALGGSAEDWARPLLLVGPFGTGKTLALARTAAEVLRRDPEARVLICTQSNSAADLYVSSYFHGWVGEGTLPPPLRVYYTGRKLETLPPSVAEYATFDEEGKLRWPTTEEATKSRLIITTLSTAKFLLSCLDSPDWRAPTHILIDEAAQAMEPATLVPLALAGPKTTVILAGDPLQSGPACYSQVAKRNGLNQSLLERLWGLYEAGDPRRIHLSTNYRSHAGLVSFLAAEFYRERLVAASELAGHPALPPISVFPVRGVDRQDALSSGFFNLAEVRRVVSLVAEMGSPGWWPREAWGPFDPEAIGVLCPYQDQVTRIRQQLRRHEDKRLRLVNVEHVNNVQGKEYKVVVISTVRTLGTCEGRLSADGTRGLEGGGFLSDPRLLNTALTRAQALLAVVGDPVSLGTIGHAKGLWRQLLKAWGLRSADQPDFWPQLQRHIEFVDESLRSTDAATQRLFLNPFSADFHPAKPAPKTAASVVEYRVLVDKGDGGVTETWLPAELLEPFLGPGAKAVSPAPLFPGSVASHEGMGNGFASPGSGHYPAPPTASASFAEQQNGITSPGSGHYGGPPMLPSVLPWQYPMMNPFCLPLPLGFPLPSFTVPPPPMGPPLAFMGPLTGCAPFPQQQGASPPSLLDSSFPAPPEFLRGSMKGRRRTTPPTVEAAAPPPPDVFALANFPPLCSPNPGRPPLKS